MKKIIILIMLMAVSVLGGGFSQSTYPDSATISYDHSADCDSILAIMSHPYGTIVDSIRLYPSNSSDSSICRDTSVAGLNSWAAANYDISFEIWEQGSGSISAYGNGLHMRWPEQFDASAGSVYVKAGIVDTVRSTENVEGDSYTPDVRVTDLTDGVIKADDFDTDAIDAGALATDAAQEIAGHAAESTWTTNLLLDAPTTGDTASALLYIAYSNTEDISAIKTQTDQLGFSDSLGLLLVDLRAVKDTSIEAKAGSLYVQAVASGDDSPSGWDATDSSIVESIVWDADTAGHYTAGNYGYEALQGSGSDTTAIKTMMQNNAFATGGGSEACTLIVKDVSDSTVIEGARIVVRTLDQSTVKVNNMTTDVNGVQILELDVASYFTLITANNYTRITDTIAVAQDSTWILYMSEFDPGSPSSAGCCLVYGYIYQANGDPAPNATVSATIPDDYWPVRYDGAAIDAYNSTNTDSLGYWEMDLYANPVVLTDQADSSSVWIIDGLYQSKTIFRKEVTVPTDSTWQLTY